MNAIDQLRATHRQAQGASHLEEALRGLTDLLTSADLEGVPLYDALEHAVIVACDALDSWEAGDTPPAPKTPDTNPPAAEAPAAGAPADPRQDGLVACLTCSTPTPLEDFPPYGRGRSKSCAPCVSERARAGHKKGARTKAGRREPSDDKESV